MVQLKELPVPLEGIHFQNSSIDAVIETTEIGKGTLYVSESTLCWRSAASGEGFEMQYTSMCLHAISRDASVHPRPCIYLMVNGKICEGDPSTEEGEGDDGSGDDADPEYDPEEKVTEVKLIPDDPELVTSMYNAIQECSLLNPDPVSDMSEEEGEEEELEDEDVGATGDHEGYDSDEDGMRAPGLDESGDHGNGYETHPNQFADAEGDDS